MKNPEKNIAHRELVEMIASEYGISGNTVKLVMRGLKEITTRELASNNSVSIRGMGKFFFVKGKVNNGKSLNKKYDTIKRKSFDYPRFSCSIEFRNNVQAVNGNAPDYYYKNLPKKKE